MCKLHCLFYGNPTETCVQLSYSTAHSIIGEIPITYADWKDKKRPFSPVSFLKNCTNHSTLHLTTQELSEASAPAAVAPPASASGGGGSGLSPILVSVSVVVAAVGVVVVVVVTVVVRCVHRRRHRRETADDTEIIGE